MKINKIAAREFCKSIIRIIVGMGVVFCVFITSVVTIETVKVMTGSASLEVDNNIVTPYKCIKVDENKGEY